MRHLRLLAIALLLAGCTRIPMDYSLDTAYEAYYQGDCDKALMELSRAERFSRSRSYIQQEISLLRGHCLERQGLFVDAAQTYRFILQRYPTSEYAYRARARLQTLASLGHASEAEAK